MLFFASQRYCPSFSFDIWEKWIEPFWYCWTCGSKMKSLYSPGCSPSKKMKFYNKESYYIVSWITHTYCFFPYNSRLWITICLTIDNRFLICCYTVVRRFDCPPWRNWENNKNISNSLWILKNLIIVKSVPNIRVICFEFVENNSHKIIKIITKYDYLSISCNKCKSNDCIKDSHMYCTLTFSTTSKWKFLYWTKCYENMLY